MIDESWAFTPALEQALAIKSKQIRPSELVELYCQQIARIDPGLDSYVLLTAELAESQARKGQTSIST